MNGNEITLQKVRRTCYLGNWVESTTVVLKSIEYFLKLEPVVGLARYHSGAKVFQSGQCRKITPGCPSICRDLGPQSIGTQLLLGYEPGLEPRQGAQYIDKADGMVL
ncbi:MAG: hypothetical protein JWQ42_1151 [Edaphobacter sp.]|nr:hypothetical protein [Edaphobacter sp.]